MASVYFDQVDSDVDDALRSLIAAEFPTIKFSYSIVPSSPINDGKGLGATWNGWRALLRRLHSRHLIQRSEYKEFAVGPELVEHTVNKSLSSARIQLRKRLLLCVENDTED